MKVKNYKLRVGVSIGLFFFSITLIILAVILSQKGYIWIGIAGPILAAFSFVLFVIIMPKTNEDGSPIVIKKKVKGMINNKVNKNKKPFVSKEDWEKEEEEDDEMVFIEEIVEGD